MSQPALPTHMTCIAITTPGGPDVLKPEQRLLPEPRANEILVKVHAAGVNRPDVSQRLGRYPAPADASDLPGLEIAGEVVALGEGATQYRIGDKVCALAHGGGYAEYCAVQESHALPVPDGFSWVEAAAIPETFFTVWVNAFMTGRLSAGETALVHGGSSGIGTTAIMLAKALGAKIIVTAGSEEKLEACRKLGADVAINYRTQDFVAEVKTATGGKGVNLILDMVAGSYVQRNLECAAMDGRIVQIAFQQGFKIDSLDLRPISAKRIMYTGSALRPRTVAQKAAIAASLRETVWPLLQKGQCKPIIDSTFALADAPKAHARMEEGSHIGKIVLTV
ncbi:MAG: putative Quinone oxidoreductase [Hyphomicrobiales bacterium]|nr:putative Quinone oxidoreductase [Hyphomicrobiales bacterium]